MALDSNGFIRIPPAIEFQAEFLPAIASVSESLISLLGKSLHSLYLYGSTAQGQAQSGVSDLDVCIVLTQSISTPECHQLAKIAVDIASRYPVVCKIDFDIGVLEEVLDSENRYSWGYWLKHHCRCIYGEDLTQRFEPFKPSKAIAVAVNGDFAEVLGKYIDRLTLLTERHEQKKIQRAAARKLIRSTNLLRTDIDNSWPDTLDEYVSQFVTRYPQKADEIDYFLRESIDPGDNAVSFIQHLTAFIRWLDNVHSSS
jgi:predicted nucleotidyltransferase